MKPPMHRVPREIAEGVVHPAHVPLHAEAEPAHVRGARHHRPRRRLLGDRLRVRVLAIHGLVELPQERHGLQILVAAIFVRDPLARFTAVIEVQHRRHAVDAQPVDMELIEPIDGARDQEAANLVPSVIEYFRLPIGMKTLPPVGVLEQVRAVEIGQPVLVRREMRRHPIEHHADSLLVQVIDEVHEVLRRTEARGRREISADLISPRSAERVLHDRHDLDVREAERLDVRRQLRRHLAIRQRAVAVLGHAHPRAEVHFVERDRRVERVALAALLHPLAVGPLVSVERPDLRAGLGGRLVVHAERIGLVDAISVVARPDSILVDIADADAGDPAFPYPRLAVRLERRLRVVPAVEIADHRHAVGVGRPYREIRSVLSVPFHRARAELFVQARVRAFVEQMQVGRTQQRRRRRAFHHGRAHVPSSAIAWRKPNNGISTQSGRLFSSYRIS